MIKMGREALNLFPNLFRGHTLLDGDSINLKSLWNLA